MSTQHYNILWLDDNRRILEKNENRLINWFNAVNVRITGIQRIRDFFDNWNSRKSYNILFLDIDLGEGISNDNNGVSVYYKIREKDSSIPVVFASAYLDLPELGSKLDDIRRIDENVFFLETPLPPVHSEEFAQHINKITPLSNLQKKTTAEQYKKMVAIDVSEGYLNLKIADLLIVIVFVAGLVFFSQEIVNHKSIQSPLWKYLAMLGAMSSILLAYEMYLVFRKRSND